MEIEQHIKNQNIVLYGPNTGYKEYLISKSLHLSNTRNFEYNSDYKYIYSKTNSIYELFICKTFKNAYIKLFFKELKDNIDNMFYKNESLTLLIYNCEYLNANSLIQIKQLFEKYVQIRFILTSTYRILTFNSFFLQLFVSNRDIPIVEKMKTFQINENSESNKLIQYIFDNKTILDFKKIRDDLYKLYLHSINTSNLFIQFINKITELNISDEKKMLLVHHASQTEHKMSRGNKDLFYLENFILYFIKIM